MHDYQAVSGCKSVPVFALRVSKLRVRCKRMQFMMIENLSDSKGILTRNAQRVQLPPTLKIFGPGKTMFPYKD